MTPGAFKRPIVSRILVTFAWAITLIAALFTAACSAEAPRDPGSAEHAATPPARRDAPSSGGLSAPVPIEPLRRAAGAAFHPEAGGAFAGGGATYAVRAAGGAFELSPIHHPHAARAARAQPTAAPPAEPVRGRPARFTTARIARGAHTLDAPPAMARTAADGHLVIPRGDIDEHLRNLHGGLELSYGFARAPQGDGDLVVEVEVTGQRPAGETAAGLHFTDPESGLGVRVGRPTWIDASGRETPLPMRATAAGFALRVPEELLARSAYPALLDPVISPEIAVDTPVPGPATGQQRTPAIAFDGTLYLAAWVDRRDGTDHIVAARVMPDGTVLDPAGIHVGTGSFPSITAGGGVFLLTYAHGATSQVVHAAIVDGAGSLTGPFALGPESQYTRPRAAFDGAHFMVAWLATSPGVAEIHRARVTPAGEVLDPGGVLLATGAASRPDIAWDGAHHVVVHATGDEIRAMRLTSAGVNLDGAGLVLGPASHASAPVITFDGANHVVAWEHYLPPVDRILAARLTPQGAVLDPGGVLVQEETDDLHSLSGPSVAFDGSSTLVIWTREEADVWMADLQLARLSPAGAVLDTPPLLVTASGRNGVAAPGPGKDTLLIWESQDPPIDQSILGSRLSPQGALLDTPPLVVSRSGNAQQQPSVAFDGQSFLVVWSDDRAASSGGLWDIRATRVAPSGAVLDPLGIDVHTSSDHGEAMPRAAFDGTSTLVAFWHCTLHDDGDGLCSTFARRVSPEGTVLGGGPTTPSLLTYPSPPPLAASGGAGSVLIAGSDDVSGERTYLLVDQAGAITSSAILGPSTWSSRQVSAFDGTNHLIVWSEDRLGTGIDQLYGARVSPAGLLLDAGGFPIAAPAAGPTHLAAAFGGGHHLIAWQETDAALRAVRVTPQATVLDPQPLEIAATAACPGAALDPSGVVFDGERWIIAWRGCGPDGMDVFGAELSLEGAVLSTFPITADAAPDSAPALASTGEGVTLVAYSSFREDAPAGTTRVLFRMIGAQCDPDACAPPDACHEPATCDPAGGCAYAERPDGTPCDGGSCQGGVCEPAGAGGGGGAPATDTGDAPLRFGCDCRAGATPSPAGGAWALALLAALGGLARRRRARR